MSDYISREAAIEAVREIFSCETCNGSNIGTICTFCNVGQAILLIKNIPAADVAEVRHGRWIVRKEHINLADGSCKEWYNFFCSECDAPNNSPTDFCPSCGAKEMDVEDESNGS